MPEIPTDPTIDALRAAYAAGLAPTAVIADVYRRIEAASDPGIFISLLPEAEAMRAAEALGAFAPAHPPLWGIPFAVKDNIDVAGLPTTAACAEFAYTPEVDAVAVARLRAQGALVVGKTNLDQFATGLVGVRTPYPVPRNAIDPAYVPGGSSSGSAVAVARGLVPFALGTDTAGSGRVPAALNNIVGLKPTLGSVSGRGMVPACRTLDTISVFAGTVEDADAVFRAIAAYDPADPYSRPLPIPARPGFVPPGLRIGVPDELSLRFGGDALSEAAFAAVLADLGRLGPAGTPRPIDLAPCFAVAALLYTGPWVAERYQAIRPVIEGRPEMLHPTTRQVISGATRFSAADAFEGLYRLAELRREADRIWEAIDVLVVPTYPRPRTLADLAADPIGPNSELGTYTNFVNLLDWCALAIPGPVRSDGFPSGVTLIAPCGRDGVLAALGLELHRRAGLRIGATDTPVPFAPAIVSGPVLAEAGEIEIVVVGAHLSGMPLNAELTGRGGRLLRAGPTAPDYRLYALPGGPPERPGLLRVATGQGAGIATETWALPPDGFGTFVAGIPAPLGIGRTRLADGTTPSGFIVEPEGLAGAVDITEFGGWRSYLAAMRPPTPNPG